MAKGSADGPCVKCYLAFALTLLIALAATGVWNPFPQVWQWVNRTRPLSSQDIVWQQRMGGTPTSATITGNTVVVEERTVVEARSLSTGVQLWQRKADWAAVAGGDQDSVVAVGKLLVKGYELIDPESGAVRRRDGSAVAVWTYRNALLDAHCAAAKDCTLTAWDPRGSTPRWTVALPGISAGLIADNPTVLGTRRLTARQVEDDAGGPEPMPSLLGLPVDGRVIVVDTATGQVVLDTQPDRDDRLVVVGGRVLRIQARASDGSCYFTVAAQDPANGQEVWRRTGINLRTADGAGCEQREDPQGGRNVVVGVQPDAREVVIDAYDGRLLWVGGAGERLVAVDDRYALARGADGRSVNAHELAFDTQRWSYRISSAGTAALTRYAAVVVDQKPDRIVALSLTSGGELADLRSTAKVFAVGSQGMIIGDGRDLAYVRFGAGAASDSGPGIGEQGTPPGGSDGSTGNGPRCGGPKNEECPPPADGTDG